MAEGIKTIVDELKTVAEAHSEITKFIFDEVGAVNFKDRKQGDTIFLVDAQPVNWAVAEVAQNFLPRKLDITLNCYTFQTFPESEKAAKTLQQKYFEVSQVHEQVLAEVMRRTVETGTDIHITTLDAITGIEQKDSDNMLYVRVQGEVSFTVVTGCTTGTFSY